MLGYLLLGLLFGAAVVTIVYMVNKHISLAELPELVRSALKNSQEKKASQLLSQFFKAHIEEIENNTITFSAFADQSEDLVKIKITGMSVGQEIYKGMELYC